MHVQDVTLKNGLVVRQQLCQVPRGHAQLRPRRVHVTSRPLVVPTVGGEPMLLGTSITPEDGAASVPGAVRVTITGMGVLRQTALRLLAMTKWNVWTPISDKGNTERRLLDRERRRTLPLVVADVATALSVGLRSDTEKSDSVPVEEN